MPVETIENDCVNSRRSRANRRAARRHPAKAGRAWLGWRVGGEFLMSPAFVIDISLGGCLMAAEVEPPLNRIVLIRLDGPLLPVWFEARVQEVRSGEAAVRAVRLIFPDFCPYDLYMAVAYGRADQEASRRQPHLPAFHGSR
jgi:hypothetical protein